MKSVENKMDPAVTSSANIISSSDGAITKTNPNYINGISELPLRMRLPLLLHGRVMAKWNLREKKNTKFLNNNNSL